MTHATPRPFDIDGDGFVNFDATGYSVEAYKIKPLLDTLDEATAALRGILADIEYIIEDGTLRREYVESNPSWQRAKAVLAKLEGGAR